MSRKHKADVTCTAATAVDKVSFEVMVDKSLVRVFYRVPIKDILQYMEEQVGTPVGESHDLPLPLEALRQLSVDSQSNPSRHQQSVPRSLSLPVLVGVAGRRPVSRRLCQEPLQLHLPEWHPGRMHSNGVAIRKASLSLKEGFKEAPHPIQQWTSDICEDYVLYYLYHRCRGTPCLQLCNIFHPATYLHSCSSTHA